MITYRTLLRQQLHLLINGTLCALLLISAVLALAPAAPTASACDVAAQRVYVTQDYTPAARDCLGEEDDPRVALALDHGVTFDTWAASHGR